MGKLSSTIGALGKAAKGVSKSKVVRKGAILGKKAVRGAKKGLNQAQVKGSKFLQKSVARIKPIREDLKQGGIRKINKLVESRVQNLIPKLSNKVEEKVDSFDPNKFLGKIFDGGLNSLKSFGSSLDGMKGRFDSTVEFLGKANELASKFVKKLATAKPKKGGGGGIFGKLIKGVAIAGAAALGTAVVAKVAVAGGAVKGAKSLLKRGIDFVRSRKKKKLEKKQEEAKVKKDKGNANIFKSILDKFSNVLNFDGTPKAVKKFKSQGKDNFRSKINLDESSKDYRFRRFTDTDGDKKVHDLKVSFKDGQIQEHGDDEVTRRIVKIKNELMELEEDHTDNLTMGKRDDEDKAAAKEIMKKIVALEKELNELIPLAKGTTTVEGTRKNVGKVMKDPAFDPYEKGKDGKDGKSKPGQIFNNIKNTFGGVKEKAGNFLKGVGKALKPKPSGEKNNRKNSRIKSGETITKDPISFADDAVQQAESTVTPNERKKQAATDMANEVAKSPKSLSTPSGAQSGPAGNSVIPLPLAVPKVNNPADKMQRANIRPANKVPSLLSVDAKNMHIIHAKSVYNIVDAL
tara:strand:+ start:152 stop:1873 length:1722 start_codon:yes stop_codon:yes gene_type:complete